MSVNNIPTERNNINNKSKHLSFTHINNALMQDGDKDKGEINVISLPFNTVDIEYDTNIMIM